MIARLFQKALRTGKPLRREVDLRLVPLGFAALIAAGAALLTLPWAHQPGRHVGTLDAIFLSTSAACVTGLVTVNVGETFSAFGQAVLLALIQLGGIGIVTAGMLLALAAGRRLSLADEQTIRATLGRLRHTRPLDLFLYSCVFVLLLQLAGAVALFLIKARATPVDDPWQLAWESVFHSVSAFCNAGISLNPQGMRQWAGEPAVLLVVSLLIIAGSIGMLALINLRYYHFWRRDPRRRGRLTLGTRIALSATGILLLGGALLTWAFEHNRTHAGVPLADQLMWSLFHAVNRTSGFSVVNLEEMNPPTLLATMVLMFIGGSPASMAGGIKTITVAVLLMTAWAALRRRGEVQLWDRRLPARVAYVATMLALLAAATVMTGTGLLMFIEEGRPASQTKPGWLGLLFEVVSAFGTVGLSTGVTPLLTDPGKLVIVALMFAGRIGPLMLALYLSRPPTPRKVRPPAEEIALG